MRTRVLRTRAFFLVGATLLAFAWGSAARAQERPRLDLGPDPAPAHHVAARPGLYPEPALPFLDVSLPGDPWEIDDKSRTPTYKARGQNYEVPPVLFTGPLSHPRYEDGGFFVGMQFLYWRQTRPLHDQSVAVRGFVDVDGSIGGIPGNFIGSGDEALNVEQLRGPGTYQPGFNLTLGWRFESGTVLSLNWYHLWDARYSATASLAPPGYQGGPGLEDTFLTSFVYNFPADYGGNPFNAINGNPGATFGIWNAASLMTIDFIQRFDMFDVTARLPLYQTDNYRYYGLVGPRLVWFWERFRWRTVDADPFGQASGDTTAIYSNVTSNRLYGLHGGVGNEWWLGHTPAGGFAFSVDTEAAFYIDFVKGRAKYELADRSTAASRARNMYSLVPEVDVRFNLWWYPWEAISVAVGYDAFMFFNTVSSPEPIDFNVGGIDPEWRKGTFRFIHGITMSVSFVF